MHMNGIVQVINILGNTSWVTHLGDEYDLEVVQVNDLVFSLYTTPGGLNHNALIPSEGNEM